MDLFQAWKLAARSILGSKMRSFLTMLGIIIGVASVIILVSLMDGMTNSMTSAFDSMGTNLISVSLKGRSENQAMDVDDMYQLVADKSDYLQAVTPSVSATATIKYGNTSLDTTTTTGVGEDYCSIKSIGISNGRFIQYVDISSRKNTCVIGSYLEKEFFSGSSPIGEILKINGNAYTIVGVLEEKASSEESSTDDAVYIPYTNAAKLSFTGRITNFSFSAVDAQKVTKAMSIIEAALNEVYGSDDYYSVTSMEEAVESITSLTGMMTMVLVGIAGISLLVGGIGIMNIMLVSVTERTREIGIRKSLGARRRDIMRQFVIEAGATSSIGGLIGIGIGSITSVAAGNIIGLRASPSAFAIILSFGVSVGIGVGFGYLPASKAAKLNPIDALRSD